MDKADKNVLRNKVYHSTAESPQPLTAWDRSLALAHLKRQKRAWGVCLAVAITPQQLQSLNLQEEINQQEGKLSGRPKGHLRPERLLDYLPATHHSVATVLEAGLCLRIWQRPVRLWIDTGVWSTQTEHQFTGHLQRRCCNRLLKKKKEKKQPNYRNDFFWKGCGHFSAILSVWSQKVQGKKKKLKLENIDQWLKKLLAM